MRKENLWWHNDLVMAYAILLSHSSSRDQSIMFVACEFSNNRGKSGGKEHVDARLGTPGFSVPPNVTRLVTLAKEEVHFVVIIFDLLKKKNSGQRWTEVENSGMEQADRECCFQLQFAIGQTLDMQA
jgi:hypothetical protein